MCSMNQFWPCPELRGQVLLVLLQMGTSASRRFLLQDLPALPKKGTVPQVSLCLMTAVGYSSKQDMLGSSEAKRGLETALHPAGQPY